MARINLLPWREERRKQRENEFYAFLGLSAVIGIALVATLVLYFNYRINDQQLRNDYVRAEISRIDIKIKEVEGYEKERESLLNRKNIIEQLQGSRSRMPRLLDELVRTIPDGVHLTTIQQAGEVVTLEGFAESHARVSNYMDKIEASGWLNAPELGIVEAKDNESRSRYEFKLKFSTSKPKPIDGEEGAEGSEVSESEGASS